ncbi:MAG: adenylosuccinate lyase [Candidatus Omnitrophica bacterium]|nr:adenylosuccinate lyase [Candidatus Omnitrophota bacterium]
MIERYTRPEMAKIWTDQNRFAKMLDVEIYACEAFAKLGMVPGPALENIRKKAAFDVKRIQEIEEKTNHDVVAFIKNISENIGDDAKYLHFGLTSSDILDTALSSQMAEAMDILIKGAEALKAALKIKAIQHKKTPMMGRSHGVHAEPTSFGLKMALFYREVERDIERMKAARKDIAVGKISGAVGTFANVDPFVEEYVCEKMGLEPARVSSQVIQRDRHAYYMSVLAITAATLEKIAVEIRGLQRTEIGEAQEYFAAGQTGSSAMPHKQNPIISERVTGLARILRSNAMAAIENVALWHERDISHSSVERVIVPDSTILLDYMLDKTTKLIEKLVVNKSKMMENIGTTKGLIFSQRLLLELIRKGVTRVDAYDIVQQLALKAIAEGKGYEAVVSASGDVKKYLSPDEIKDCFSLEYHMKRVDEVFKKIGIE